MTRTSDIDAVELVNLIQELGFARTVGSCYLKLLKNGALTVDQIESELDVSRDEVRSCIQTLLRLRLIGRGRRRDRTLYYAVDPALAWLSIVADLIWSRKVDIGPMRSLAATADLRVERVRVICTRAAELAEVFYEPQTEVAQHKEHDAQSSNELAQLICECIYQAQNTILAVSKTPRQPQLSSYWAVLTDRLSHGVIYHRIVDLGEVVDHGLKIVTRDMEIHGIDIRVLEQTRIQNKFYLIDNKYLGVYDSEPLAVGHKAGRVTTQPQIIARYKQRFWKYHAEAIPGSFVVDVLRKAGGELLQRAKEASLRAVQVGWLEDLIDYGKFSRFYVQEAWSSEQIADLERVAIGARLVLRNSDGLLVPQYAVDASSLRSIYSV